MWDSPKASFHIYAILHGWEFFYEKAVLWNLDASFTTCRINLIPEPDIFLLRPCHCPHGLHYLNKADPKSWALAKIKTSSLTSRETGSSVCKRFRRAITHKTRRGRNFYHDAVRRPEILITRAERCQLYRGKFDREIRLQTYVHNSMARHDDHSSLGNCFCIESDYSCLEIILSILLILPLARELVSCIANSYIKWSWEY